MDIDWRTAIENAASLGFASRPAAGDDRRLRDGRVYPMVHPKFKLEAGCSIFTIGSCFARHLEEKLEDFDLPTRGFAAPKEEWPHRPNGLLNEFNPGSMYQRIVKACTSTSFSDADLIPVTNSVLDLLLRATIPVPHERALLRRAEIDSVYRALVTSDAVVITLGLVETWFDQETGLYLNQMPPLGVLRSHPQRFCLRILDVDESYRMLSEAIDRLLNTSECRILLTVSPVPMQATFSGEDLHIANSFSKSVLRICASRASRQFERVDYFPSFEIVMSGGLDSFDDDNVHVRNDVVESVVGFMRQNYVRASSERPVQSAG